MIVAIIKRTLFWSRLLWPNIAAGVSCYQHKYGSHCSRSSGPRSRHWQMLGPMEPDPHPRDLPVYCVRDDQSLPHELIPQDLVTEQGSVCGWRGGHIYWGHSTHQHRIPLIFINGKKDTKSEAPFCWSLIGLGDAPRFLFTCFFIRC